MKRSSRREFTRTLAAMTAMPLLASSCMANNQPATTPPPQVQQPALPETDHLVEIVRIRFGKNISNEQMAEIKKSIERMLRIADSLKQLKLSNGDDPAVAFSADLP